MALKDMTAEQIQQELESLGETGRGRLRGYGLYTQREENADWLFVGFVNDIEEAKRVIEEFYNR